MVWRLANLLVHILASWAGGAAEGDITHVLGDLLHIDIFHPLPRLSVLFFRFRIEGSWACQSTARAEMMLRSDLLKAWFDRDSSQHVGVLFRTATDLMKSTSF